MKILLVHNYYQQPGGEDVCFADEGRLLEAHGHDVIRFTLHNDSIKHDGTLRAAARAFWSRESYRHLSQLIARERPAVMHCTNTFPLVSPSAYYAARRQGVAVVQALHNYRLVCPGALLMRDGAACENCLGKTIAWSAIRHKCYRESRAASAVVAGMAAAHRLRGTWSNAVDRYYALTAFARGKLIEGGLPAEKLMVKPNFVFSPAAEPNHATSSFRSDYFVFVGRLSVEKGIRTALEAWTSQAIVSRLLIVGDGPLADEVRKASGARDRIEWLGALPNERAIAMIAGARALLAPSVCYENFPRSIVESFAVRTPVIASRLGAMQELVDDGRTGLLFQPGDAADLARAANRLAMCDGEEAAALGEAAGEEYSRKYTPEQNYRTLIEIYRQAIAARSGEPTTDGAPCEAKSEAPLLDSPALAECD